MAVEEQSELPFGDADFLTKALCTFILRCTEALQHCGTIHIYVYIYIWLFSVIADTFPSNRGGDPCFAVSRQHPPPPGGDDG